MSFAMSAFLTNLSSDNRHNFEAVKLSCEMIDWLVDIFEGLPNRKNPSWGPLLYNARKTHKKKLSDDENEEKKR